jgi:hypothetical protein
MSKIVDILNHNGRPGVLCSPHESEFNGATAITISDNNGATVEISKFCIERNYVCFSDKPAPPWFWVEEDIDNNFLQKGNRVDFVFN